MWRFYPLVAVSYTHLDVYKRQNEEYPVYLYYNPYKEDKKVIYKSSGSVDLYDKLTHAYLQKNINGVC